MAGSAEKRRVMRIDPTRTRLLRSKFEKDMRSRMNQLKREIQELLDGEDQLGLTINARWSFIPSVEKINKFSNWLKNSVNKLFGVTEETTDVAWTDEHVEAAYEKGARQARMKVVEKSRASADVLQSLTTPASLQRVKLIQTRAYESIQGLTNHTTDKLGAILTEGLIIGDSPRKVARDISREITSITKKRALTIARTETIRAHAEGQLDEMESLGVTEVGVDVEWSATKLTDGTFESRVCPKCRPLDGMVIPIKRARGLIPRHPNCRCAWVPAIEDNPKLPDIRKRIRKSIKTSLPKNKKRTLKEQMAQETWKGADV